MILNRLQIDLPGFHCICFDLYLFEVNVDGTILRQKLEIRQKFVNRLNTLIGFWFTILHLIQWIVVNMYLHEQDMTWYKYTICFFLYLIFMSMDSGWLLVTVITMKNTDKTHYCFCGYDILFEVSMKAQMT